MPAYRNFLSLIGYLQPEPQHVSATTANVDLEISEQAGPQLVVPASNARYALNAANARWGSLYDALYGTDVISTANGAEIRAGYNPLRGAKVIAFARNLLDTSAPLAKGSHNDATGYHIERSELRIALADGSNTVLQQPEKYVGSKANRVSQKRCCSSITACISKSGSTRNAGDAHYRPMARDFKHSTAFKAACALVFKGVEQPSGYTEPLLYEFRLAFKDQH